MTNDEAELLADIIERDITYQLSKMANRTLSEGDKLQHAAVLTKRRIVAIVQNVRNNMHVEQALAQSMADDVDWSRDWVESEGQWS